MIWFILAASAVAVVVFVERVVHFHRAQINSMEFLNGVRNVLKRDNVVEALSICDATPGPVARLVKVAILNRERGREGVREALEEAGLVEVPPLEDKLNLIATIAQIAPIMGLLGTVLGFIRIFKHLESQSTLANVQDLSGGRVAGADLHGGGAGCGGAELRRLQLSGQPRQRHRARHGEGGDGDREPRHRNAGTEIA